MASMQKMVASGGLMDISSFDFTRWVHPIVLLVSLPGLLQERPYLILPPKKKKSGIAAIVDVVSTSFESSVQQVRFFDPKGLIAIVKVVRSDHVDGSATICLEPDLVIHSCLPVPLEVRQWDPVPDKISKSSMPGGFTFFSSNMNQLRIVVQRATLESSPVCDIVLDVTEAVEMTLNTGQSLLLPLAIARLEQLTSANFLEPLVKSGMDYLFLLHYAVGKVGHRCGLLVRKEISKGDGMKAGEWTKTPGTTEAQVISQFLNHSSSENTSKSLKILRCVLVLEERQKVKTKLLKREDRESLSEWMATSENVWFCAPNVPWTDILKSAKVSPNMLEIPKNARGCHLLHVVVDGEAQLLRPSREVLLIPQQNSAGVVSHSKHLSIQILAASLLSAKHHVMVDCLAPMKSLLSSGSSYSLFMESGAWEYLPFIEAAHVGDGTDFDLVKPSMVIVYTIYGQMYLRCWSSGEDIRLPHADDSLAGEPYESKSHNQERLQITKLAVGDTDCSSIVNDWIVASSSPVASFVTPDSFLLLWWLTKHQRKHAEKAKSVDAEINNGTAASFAPKSHMSLSLLVSPQEPIATRGSMSAQSGNTPAIAASLLEEAHTWLSSKSPMEQLCSDQAVHLFSWFTESNNKLQIRLPGTEWSPKFEVDIVRTIPLLLKGKKGFPSRLRLTVAIEKREAPFTSTVVSIFPTFTIVSKCQSPIVVNFHREKTSFKDLLGPKKKLLKVMKSSVKRDTVTEADMDDSDDDASVTSENTEDLSSSDDDDIISTRFVREDSGSEAHATEVSMAEAAYHMSHPITKHDLLSIVLEPGQSRPLLWSRSSKHQRIAMKVLQGSSDWSGSVPLYRTDVSMVSILDFRTGNQLMFSLEPILGNFGTLISISPVPEKYPPYRVSNFTSNVQFTMFQKDGVGAVIHEVSSGDSISYIPEDSSKPVIMECEFLREQDSAHMDRLTVPLEHAGWTKYINLRHHTSSMDLRLEIVADGPVRTLEIRSVGDETYKKSSTLMVTNRFSMEEEDEASQLLSPGSFGLNLGHVDVGFSLFSSTGVEVSRLTVFGLSLKYSKGKGNELDVLAKVGTLQLDDMRLKTNHAVAFGFVPPSRVELKNLYDPSLQQEHAIVLRLSKPDTDFRVELYEEVSLSLLPMFVNIETGFVVRLEDLVREYLAFIRESKARAEVMGSSWIDEQMWCKRIQSLNDVVRPNVADFLLASPSEIERKVRERSMVTRMQKMSEGLDQDDTDFDANVQRVFVSRLYLSVVSLDVSLFFKDDVSVLTSLNLDASESTPVKPPPEEHAKVGTVSSVGVAFSRLGLIPVNLERASIILAAYEKTHCLSTKRKLTASFKDHAVGEMTKQLIQLFGNIAVNKLKAQVNLFSFFSPAKERRFRSPRYIRSQENPRLDAFVLQQSQAWACLARVADGRFLRSDVPVQLMGTPGRDFCLLLTDCRVFCFHAAYFGKLNWDVTEFDDIRGSSIKHIAGNRLDLIKVEPIKTISWCIGWHNLQEVVNEKNHVYLKFTENYANLKFQKLSRLRRKLQKKPEDSAVLTFEDSNAARIFADTLSRFLKEAQNINVKVDDVFIDEDAEEIPVLESENNASEGLAEGTSASGPTISEPAATAPTEAEPLAVTVPSDNPVVYEPAYVHKEGWLGKRGENINKKSSENNRYFVLHDGCVTYSVKPGSAIKGKIPICGVELKIIVGDTAPNRCAFLLALPHRTYYIIAGTDRERLDWMEAFHRTRLMDAQFSSVLAEDDYFAAG
jgi:hypothetical protein